MKKLYIEREKFFNEHSQIKPINNIYGINTKTINYLIDRESLAIYKICHIYKEPVFDQLGSYDMVLAELETRSARDKQGYRVCRFGKRIIPVYKIVAATFIDNPLGYKDVMHLDNSHDNDTVENLAWCTRSALVKSYYDRKKNGGFDMTDIKTAKKVIDEDDFEITWSDKVSGKINWDKIIWSTPPETLDSEECRSAVENPYDPKFTKHTKKNKKKNK